LKEIFLNKVYAISENFSGPLPLAAMVIAVNTRFLLKDELEGCGYFIREMFDIIVKKHPEHKFYFLFDRPFAEEFVFAPNVTPVVVSPPARHPVLWRYWFDLKVPLVLKKIKADVFVSTDGYCSLTSKIPQCMVVHDLGFLHMPEAYKNSHVRFLKSNMPKYLKKANRIVTISGFSKNDILSHYKIKAEKIDVVYNGVKENFQPVSGEEKVAVKEKYTEGKEFFIYVGAIQPRKNLVNLLKAYSIFKKRLHSGMKLVLAGRLAWKNDEFLQLLKTYKYKDDVVLTGYLKEHELASLFATAYALVYPSLFEGFGVPVIEAMKMKVPVLTSEKTSMQEIAGEAALYFDPNDHEDIAEKMMLIYKDENLRKQLIEKSGPIVLKYNWESAAELFWESILKTADGASGE
jgi:glycosyltransferase involved in cell wall biosynthesis